MIRRLTRNPFPTLVSVALLVATPTVATGASEGSAEKARSPSAEQLLEKMSAAAEPNGKMRAELELTMTNREGKDVSWTGELYWRSEAGKAEGTRRLVLDGPKDVEGVEYLVTRASDGTDRIRMYLPALDRTRTIRTELHGEPFFGTDFNYEDLGFEQIDYEKHEVIGESEIAGRPCVQVESIPDEPFGYGRILRCIDEETHLPMRTDFFDRGGELWKVRTIEETKKVDGTVVPTKIVMQDMQGETRSRIELGDVRLDESLPNEAFTLLGTRSLEKGEEKKQKQAS